MFNNKQINITIGNTRKAVQWDRETLLLSDFAERFRNPVRSTETIDEYLALPKSQQDELKDVGGYVGGVFKGTRRKAADVVSRSLVTLDFDNIPAGQTADLLRRVDGLGCCAIVHSSRKHTEYAPRLRVIVPLNEDCSADEYEPIARLLAKMIAIEYCDPTTFEASRLMYYPSVSMGAPYVCEIFDKPFLSKNGMLGLYVDWRDVTAWAQVPGQETREKQHLTKQQDPETKQGIVGAFCRTYDVLTAMGTFIPGIYEPTETPNRFTYTGGSTTGGAVLYDGKFLYSHHATDPCSGQLVNAWDMVRLHKFGDLDEETLPNTPSNRLPSYLAMSDLAVTDTTVKSLIAKERYLTASEAFADTTVVSETDWMQKLAVDRAGNYEKTIDNICIILRYDERLRGKIVTDIFVGGAYVIGALPWNPSEERRRWIDADDSGLRWYLEHYYGIVAREKTYDALAIIGGEVKINVVSEYLASLQWDGKPRLDTIFVDYLGAQDTPYTRAVTRKTFVAACARAVTTDGVKFDTMPILIGPQGIGKSTLLATLGKDWFSDSLTTFEGKDAAEMLQGTWINEVGELTAMSRHETNAVKQFLSKQKDIYRAAYGRRTDEYPRRCIFIGTSNHHDVLKDTTGNRRFWPIETMILKPTKNVWNDLPGEVDQIWAEAYFRFMIGEPLHLSTEEEKEAKAVQSAHEEADDLYGVIEDFVETEIPITWDTMSTSDRRMWLNGQLTGIEEIETMKRKRVCAREVYYECLGKNGGDTDQRLIRRINTILQQLPGWERVTSPQRYHPYGHQRGFARVDDS